MQTKTLAESIASALSHLSIEELRSIRELAGDIVYKRENTITTSLKKFTELAA